MIGGKRRFRILSRGDDPVPHTAGIVHEHVQSACGSLDLVRNPLHIGHGVEVGFEHNEALLALSMGP